MMTFYSVLPGASYPLEVHSITTETPPMYPSAFWRANPGKPQIFVYTEKIEILYNRVSDMLNSLTWDDKLISSYLVAVIKENKPIFETTSSEAWTADNIAICAANENITPLSLLNVTSETPPEKAPQSNIGSTIEERRSRFYAIILLFRKTIAKSNNETYGVDLGRHLNQMFEGSVLVMKEADATAWVGCLGDQHLTPQYKRIISAIDMFFFRHSALKYAMIRMATLPSRYRGCVALTALGQVSNLVGLKPSELVRFMLTKPVAKDVAHIVKSGEGAENQNGYFPYHLDMGMTSKSAYSLAVNPTLCLWLHVIGCVNGYPRSMNARMPEAVNLYGTFESAAVVGLILGSATDIQKPFLRSEAAVDELRTNLEAARQVRPLTEEEFDDDEECDEEVSLAHDASVDEKVTYAIYLMNKNKGLSPAQKETLRGRATKCKNCNENTVGQMFYRFYGGAK